MEPLLHRHWCSVLPWFVQRSRAHCDCWADLPPFWRFSGETSVTPQGLRAYYPWHHRQHELLGHIGSAWIPLSPKADEVMWRWAQVQAMRTQVCAQPWNTECGKPQSYEWASSKPAHLCPWGMHELCYPGQKVCPLLWRQTLTSKTAMEMFLETIWDAQRCHGELVAGTT